MLLIGQPATAGAACQPYILVCGCLISLLTFGLRNTFGLFTVPVSTTFDWSRETFALAMAIQNLAWGIGQPFADALADRFGPARVLAGGGLLYASGLASMAISTTPGMLHMSAGLLVGFGMAGASFITVLAAFSKIVPPEHRSWALGLGTAAGSLGQFLVVPAGQGLITAFSWETATLWLAGSAALVPILARAFAGSECPKSNCSTTELGLAATLRVAHGHTSYVLLLSGFFVCGFHLAFITIHMPPYLVDRGVDASLAAWASRFKKMTVYTKDDFARIGEAIGKSGNEVEACWSKFEAGLLDFTWTW